MNKKDMINNALGRFHAEDFTEWLRKGIVDFNGEKSLNAFSPLSHLIGYSDNFIQDLTKIYYALSEKAQKNFKNGIVLNLLQYPQDRATAQWLLRLSGTINNTKILPAINNWLNAGYLEYIRPHYPEPNDQSIALNERKEFFALVIDTIVGFAGNEGSVRHEVAKTLRKLMYCELFKDEYIPIVFIALCRAEPKSLSLHIKKARSHFTRMHEKEGNVGDSWMTAQRVAHYVPIKVIQNNIHEMPDWMLWGLFQHEKAPLKVVKK